MLRVVALVSCLLLMGCGEDASEPVPVSAKMGAKSSSDIAAAKAEAEAQWPAQPLPDGVPEAPVTGACLTGECAVKQVQFANKDWPLAWRGDYAAQRNVAFCLQDSCQGAVMQNKLDACAWRAIITATQIDEIHEGDTTNLELACGGLSETEKMAAVAKSEAIEARIR